MHVQTFFLILLALIFIWTISINGRWLLNINRFIGVKFKSSRGIEKTIKIMLSILSVVLLLSFLNNNDILHFISGKNKNFGPSMISILGAELGVITFWKNIKQKNIDKQHTQFYKMLDMLNAFVQQNSEKIEKIGNFLIVRINTSHSISEDLLVSAVLLKHRTSNSASCLLMQHQMFITALENYSHENPNKDPTAYKQAKKFIDIMDISDRGNNGFAYGLPSNSQKKYTNLLVNNIVLNNDNFKNLKDELSDTEFLIHDQTIDILEKIHFIPFFSRFLPTDVHWKSDASYAFFNTCNVVNNFFNDAQNRQLISSTCRYINKSVKIINNSSMNVDEKYIFYGMIRNTLSPELLLIVFISSTFSKNGLGLSRQLIGTSFFGDKSDLYTAQHIDFNRIQSKKVRLICTGLMKNYYTRFIYPGDIKFRMTYMELMNSIKKK